MTRPESELKRLLLSAELDLLEQLRERCRKLEDRVGDSEALKQNVQPIFLDVLRETGVREHDRMARLLAPLVLASIREEIRNSQDMLVDALYPITGRLVSAAVRNAFRELIETINEKLDEGLSLERWKIRFKARLTGRSQAELLLHQNPPFVIEDLMVIHRSSGLLIARASGDLDQGHPVDPDDREVVDGDLVSGMLTAILTFVREAMGGDDTSELRTLNFGDSELYIRTSPAVVLAVKTRGTPVKGFEGALESLFFDFIDRWGEVLRDFTGEAEENMGETLVVDLGERFRALQRARRRHFREGPPRKGYAVVAALLLLLFAWMGTTIYGSWRVAQIEARAQEAITALPALVGYPLSVRYDSADEALRVEGLVPDAEAASQLDDALAQRLPEVESRTKLTALPTDQLERLAGRLDQQAKGLESALTTISNTLDSRVQSIDRRSVTVEDSLQAISQNLGLKLNDLGKRTGSLESLDGQLGQLDRKTADLEALTRQVEASVETWSQSLVERLAATEAKLAAMENRQPGPLERLEAWTGRNAVYFSKQTALQDAIATEAKLQYLAKLLMEAPADVQLRVVGYADAIGGIEVNKWVSLNRARLIAERIEALAVPAERLLIVGRADESPNFAGDGKQEGNRRVEFELVYPGTRNPGRGDQ